MRSISGRVAISLVCAWALQAQNATSTTPQGANPIANEFKGMPPRAAPGDYATHVKVGDYTLALEFAGHNVPRPDDPLTTDEYVVVEAAMYGPAGSHLALSPQNFELHINDKKPMTGSSFVVVASSLRDPEWIPPEQHKEKPKTSFGGGGGEDTSTLPPKIPIELQRKMTMYIRDAALPVGERPLPVAGLLFFPYRGKTSGIHLLELTYTGPAGKAIVPLQP
jgi:hypothetical protein